MKLIYYVNQKPVYVSPSINKKRGHKLYYCQHERLELLTNSLSTLQETIAKQENLPDFGSWERKSAFQSIRNFASNMITKWKNSSFES